MSGIEISFDARRRVYSEDALALLFGVIVRTHWPSRDVTTQPHDRPRFTRLLSNKATTSHVLQYNRKSAQLSDDLLLRTAGDISPTFDSTYYVGARGSACSWRTMVKVLDQQNKAAGTSRRLEEHERRVRLEVTLQGSELSRIGLNTVDDLRTFRFQTLQGSYFQFRLPTFQHRTGPSDAVRAVGQARQRLRRRKFLTAGIVGLQAWDEASRRALLKACRESRAFARPVPPPRRGDGEAATLVRYEALTIQVIQALRHLGNRQRRSLS